MLSKTAERRILKKCRQLHPHKIGNQDYVHYTVLLLRGKIIKIGINNRKKTHTKAMFYKFPFIHSEFNAIINRGVDFKKCTLVNLRINRVGRLLNSKPCEFCGRLICKCNFKKVIFSTETGFMEYV